MSYSKLQKEGREINHHEGRSSIINKLLRNPKRSYENRHGFNSMSSISWFNSIHLNEARKSDYYNQTMTFSLTHWVQRSFVVNVHSVEWVTYFFSPFLIGQSFDPFGLVCFFGKLGISWLEFAPIYTIQATEKLFQK